GQGAALSGGGAAGEAATGGLAAGEAAAGGLVAAGAVVGAGAVVAAAGGGAVGAQPAATVASATSALPTVCQRVMCMPETPFSSDRHFPGCRLAGATRGAALHYFFFTSRGRPARGDACAAKADPHHSVERCDS